MSYKVALRENATGEVRMHESSGDFNDWWWTDGNGACDCNRHLFFNRVVDADYDDEGLNDGDGFDCGATAYSALYAELPDGSRIQLQEGK